MSAALDHAVEDPDLERVVEAVPDVSIAQLITADTHEAVTSRNARDGCVSRGVG
jgi:hypothetical protein